MTSGTVSYGPPGMSAYAASSAGGGKKYDGVAAKLNIGLKAGFLFGR